MHAVSKFLPLYGAHIGTSLKRDVREVIWWGPRRGGSAAPTHEKLVATVDAALFARARYPHSIIMVTYADVEARSVCFDCACPVTPDHVGRRLAPPFRG